MASCSTPQSVSIVHAVISAMMLAVLVAFAMAIWNKQVYGRAAVGAVAAMSAVDIWFVLAYLAKGGCYEDSKWRLLPALQHLWSTLAIVLPWARTFTTLTNCKHRQEQIYKQLLLFGALASIAGVVVMLAHQDRSLLTYSLCALCLELLLISLTVYVALFAFRQLELAIARSIEFYMSYVPEGCPTISQQDTRDVMSLMWSYRCLFLVLSCGVHTVLLFFFYSDVAGAHSEEYMHIPLRLLNLLYVCLLLLMITNRNLTMVLDTLARLSVRALQQGPSKINRNGHHKQAPQLPQLALPQRITVAVSNQPQQWASHTSSIDHTAAYTQSDSIVM